MSNEFSFDINDLYHKTIKNVCKNGDDFLGMYLLGSITTLTPSGKIYAPWSSNVTAAEVAADEQYFEDLKKSLPEGFFVEFYENSVFIARAIDLDTKDLCWAVFATKDTQQSFIEKHDLEDVSDGYLDDMFINFIDDVEDPKKIFDLEYLASDLLKSTDPVAYRCEFRNWIDSLLSDGSLFEISGTYYVKK